MTDRAPDGREPSPLPQKATAIVLAVWVFVLVLMALGLVPLLFAQCTPTPEG